MSHCTALWSGIATSSQVEKVGNLTNLNRFCDLCDICGYGIYSPPMNTDISLDENSFGKAIRVRNSHSPFQSTVGHIVMKKEYVTIADQWDSVYSLKSINYEKTYLKENIRGQMLKCACCGCSVHEKCLDCPSYHIIANDSQFGCPHLFILLLVDIICPSCLVGLNPDRKSHSHSKIVFSSQCCVCGLSGGFMVLTVDNCWVHKRCGLLLRNSIYNNAESYYSKGGIMNMGKAMSRTLAQFIIPSPENMGLVSNESICV